MGYSKNEIKSGACKRKIKNAKQKSRCAVGSGLPCTQIVHVKCTVRTIDGTLLPWYTLVYIVIIIEWSVEKVFIYYRLVY